MTGAACQGNTSHEHFKIQLERGGGFVPPCTSADTRIAYSLKKLDGVIMLVIPLRENRSDKLVYTNVYRFTHFRCTCPILRLYFP